MVTIATPNKRFNEQNNDCARAFWVLVHFFAVLCKTATWIDQILCILKKEKLRHSKVNNKFVFHKVSSPPSPTSLPKFPNKPIWWLTWKHVLGERSKFPATISLYGACSEDILVQRSLGPWYVWTGEYDLNTLRVDGEIFESGTKKLRIPKYPDTCGQGLRPPIVLQEPLPLPHCCTRLRNNWTRWVYKL